MQDFKSGDALVLQDLIPSNSMGMFSPIPGTDMQQPQDVLADRQQAL